MFDKYETHQQKNAHTKPIPVTVMGYVDCHMYIYKYIFIYMWNYEPCSISLYFYINYQRFLPLCLCFPTTYIKKGRKRRIIHTHFVILVILRAMCNVLASNLICHHMSGTCSPISRMMNQTQADIIMTVHFLSA